MKAIWTHGNAAQPQFVGGISITSPGTTGHQTAQVANQPWTDIVGLPQGPGKVFRGQGGTDNWFHFALPTPVLDAGKRARLEQAFVLFNSDPDVQVTAVMIFDGARAVDTSEMPAGVSGRHDGSAGIADLQDNITRFRVESRPEIFWGVGISVRVRFSREGNITFVAAGADFT